MWVAATEFTSRNRRRMGFSSSVPQLCAVVNIVLPGCKDWNEPASLGGCNKDLLVDSRPIACVVLNIMLTQNQDRQAE